MFQIDFAERLESAFMSASQQGQIYTGARRKEESMTTDTWRQELRRSCEWKFLPLHTVKYAVHNDGPSITGLQACVTRRFEYRKGK